MEQQINKWSRKEILVSDLCNEIDSLKEEVEFWKEKYEKEREEYLSVQSRHWEDTKKGVANALMFALHVKDAEDGSLVIRKEDRKVLAEQYK